MALIFTNILVLQEITEMNAQLTYLTQTCHVTEWVRMLHPTSILSIAVAKSLYVTTGYRTGLSHGVVSEHV